MAAPKPLKIRRDDWIVFSTGMGVLTYSMVTRTPTQKAAIAVVQTIDGKVYRRLIVATYKSVHDAREHAKRFNMKEKESVD